MTYPGVMPIVDMKSGYAPLDNTLIGAANTALNIVGGTVNIAVDAVGAVGSVGERFAGEIQSASGALPGPGQGVGRAGGFALFGVSRFLSRVGDLNKAARSGDGTTRVGRWMSQTEFNKMSDGGRVVEGAGGRTYVVRPPNPEAFKPPRGSTVYAEFDVPTDVLKPASKPEWSVIPGPNVTTSRYGPPPAEMPPATCITCVIKE